MIRIEGVRATIVAVPVARPIASSVRRTDRVVYVIVEVSTTADVTGVAYVAAFTPRQAIAIRALVADIGDILTGHDASRIDDAWALARASHLLIGYSGIAAFALSAVDVALWDIRGKVQSMPLHRLLGTRRKDLVAYASEGCWLDRSASQVAGDVSEFASEGFRIVKVRFGRRTVDDDFAILRELARTFGDRVQYIVDVNQGWSRETAHRVACRFDGLPVRWLEEPLEANDYQGLARLRAILPVPLAAGENAYLPDGLSDLLERDAVAVATPDIQRIGGVTGWLRATSQCEARGVSVSAHLFPEVGVHLLAAAAQPEPLEWVPWISPLLREPLGVVGGVATVPDRPGLGVEFDAGAVQAHTLE